MCSWRKSHSNTNSFRLTRQVVQAEFEHTVYGAPAIRYKAHYGTTYDLRMYDLPYRSKDFPNWKRHRKTQYRT